MVGAKPGGCSGPVMVPSKRHGTIALRFVTAGYAGCGRGEQEVRAGAHECLHSAREAARSPARLGQRRIDEFDVCGAQGRYGLSVVGSSRPRAIVR